MVRFGRFDASIAWGHIRGSSGPLQKGVPKGVKKGSFWGLRVDLGVPQNRYGGFWTHFGGPPEDPFWRVMDQNSPFLASHAHGPILGFSGPLPKWVQK